MENILNYKRNAFKYMENVFDHHFPLFTGLIPRQIFLYVLTARDGRNYEVEFDETDGPDEIEEKLMNLGLYRPDEAFLVRGGLVTHSLGKMIKDGRLMNYDTMFICSPTKGGKFN